MCVCEWVCGCVCEWVSLSGIHVCVCVCMCVCVSGCVGEFIRYTCMCVCGILWRVYVWSLWCACVYVCLCVMFASLTVACIK